MSRDYPTQGETEAYDLGFEDGKDYWQPMREEEIITVIRDWFEVDADLSEGIEPLISLIRGEADG